MAEVKQNMFQLFADKTKLTVREREPLTSGSMNVYQAQFQFSADWEGLARTAVFQAGGESRSVLLDETGACAIPWETLEKPGVHLRAGVCGTRGTEAVLPTVWADCGIIQEGATPGEAGRPPTPELWTQELAAKADGLDIDGLTLKLTAGERTLSQVKLPGQEGGASGHSGLSGRDAADQHPISSISGLAARLDRIPEPVEALTNHELEELLK